MLCSRVKKLVRHNVCIQKVDYHSWDSESDIGQILPDTSLPILLNMKGNYILTQLKNF